MAHIRRDTSIISTKLLALILAACGGGGGGGGGTSSGGTARVNSSMVTREGRVVDGPIVGATVYVDVNENGRIDDADISLGKTDDEGLFSGEVDALHGEKPLLADLEGAYDQDAPDVELSGVWRAPENARVISPLTELMVRDGLSHRELALKFGLPENINISRTDPLEISPRNVLYAEQILAAGRSASSYLNADTPPAVIVLELDVHENYPRNKPVLDLRGGSLTLTEGFGDNDKFEIRDGNRIWFKESPDFESGDTQFSLQIERTIGSETQLIQLILNVADIELERNTNDNNSGVQFHAHEKSDYREEDLPSDFVQHLLGPSYWDSPDDEPLILTWSINNYPETPQSLIDAIVHLTDASTQSIDNQIHVDLVRSLIERATQEIEAIANIKFIEVDANTNSGQIGDLHFWFVDHIGGGFSGFAHYPSGRESLIFLNGSSLDNVTELNDFIFSFVEQLRKIYLHEIGHALGLGHPFEENAGWPGNEAYRLSPDSLMSYSRAINYDGLKEADIEALQWLYGAPGEHGTGAESLGVSTEIV